MIRLNDRQNFDRFARGVPKNSAYHANDETGIIFESQKKYRKDRLPQTLSLFRVNDSLAKKLLSSSHIGRRRFEIRILLPVRLVW